MLNSKRHWTLITLMFLVLSCNKDVESLQTDSSQATVALGEKIILGEQLENPYSVKNMRLALQALKKASKKYASKTFKGDLNIQTTDYYVKFWIENKEQKNLLIADSLNLSVIPLDVEIEQEGDYMVDENTELKQSQWLYTSVEKEYQFHQGIKYEILEDLFLIEPSEAEEIEGDEQENENTTTTLAGKSGIPKNFLYDLEDQALKLTGNYTPPENNKLAARRSKRKPKGYIKVLNTVTGNLDPVVGVKIKTRRWFKWAKGWTNSRGYY
ncbi:MAG: hypothetical protein COA50_09930 [Flavobacteriaceae bacterium]|nr:MAG: hypothetical protein COA50_09930 [Flavobacteriaceae bacterium]